MKTHTKAFALWLPLMVVLSLLAWLFFGALPGVSSSGDTLAWLAELPVTTCYAAAAGGAAILGMHITGMNIDNDRRAELLDAAAGGDTAALRVLHLETFAWLAHLAVWSLFFFPHW